MMMSKSSVVIEWNIGVVRGGPGTEKFGDPYNFVCTIIRTGDDAYIMAACGEFNTDIYRSIASELKKIGVKNVTWDRKNKTERTVEVKLPPSSED
jgi:hypothetical protein